MHREFLKLLKDAVGRSELVIVVNLDIRGFTPFCQKEDSANVAMYITRVYDRIINDYFGNARFYKPAGDGLIIVIPYNRKNLKEVAKTTINSCLTLLEKFPSLCADNHMINFSTPEKIGVGVTRGNACCIHSKDEKGEDKILDYSGKILNLASRLMEMARPSGIVFDESFGIDLLEKTKELFSEENVHVRGIAEEKPVKVYCTVKYTLIPNSYKQPLKEPKWKTETHEYLLGTLESSEIDQLVLQLDKNPLDENRIIVRFIHSNPRTKEIDISYDFSVDDSEIDYEHKGGISSILINVNAITKFLREKTKGLTKDMNIQIDILYPIQ